ncbi:ankyrin repeat domain-containing protein, partial [Leptospira fletcheri]|uniref:ankyrin repeat domain-containing protein n=1 Tax=Leptospira fletcheri TaxID=2484981 RepID=UPI001AEF51DD
IIFSFRRNWGHRFFDDCQVNTISPHLEFAAMDGSKESVKLLLDAGADPHALKKLSFRLAKERAEQLSGDDESWAIFRLIKARM